MAKHFFIKIFYLSVFICHAASAQVAIQWQKSLGGTWPDFGDCIQQTTDGGFIVLGSTSSWNGYVSGNHGMSDFWVLKLDATGDTLWTKCYGGSNSESAKYVEQTFDGGYILSGTTASNNGDVSGFNGGSEDFWIVKIDGTGTIQWQNCFGGTGTELAAVVRQTNDGGYIVTGHSNSTDIDVIGNHGSFDAWVLKLDGSGAIQWKNCYGGSSADGLFSVDQTLDGGYILSGRSSSIDGDLTGNHGQYDVWVVKLNSTGVLEWQKNLGGSAWDESFFIQQTTDAGYVLTGMTNSTNGDVSGNHGLYDQWTVKLDSVGNIQWQNSLGGTSFEIGFAVRQVADGGFIVVGETQSVNIQATGNKGYIDAWLVKLDSAGNYVWHQCVGGTSYDQASSLWQTTDGNYIMSGFTFSSNGDVNNNFGDRDAWIVRFSEDYNLITGKTYADLNNNSTQDVGESSISNVKINLNGNTNFNFSSPGGNYAFPVIDPTTYNISSDTISFYNTTPLVHNVTFSGINQIDSLNDFAFQTAGTFNDLSVSITQSGMFRPGYNASYIISYKNTGTTTLTPTVIFFPDTSMDFVSAVPVQTIVSPDSITWDLGPLAPYETGNILVTVHLDSAIISGNIVVTEVGINPVINDATPGNNNEIRQTYVYSSYDPNFISVSRDTMYSFEFPNPPYLEYLVCFQNTGNDTALNVVVLNNLPSEFDETTYELIASSHPITINYLQHSRLFSYSFENIMLPDSTINEPASHGFFRYRIKPVNTLVVGDIIESAASIYFDFNQPVITNTALTEIELPVSVNELKGINGNLKAFPNPFLNEINLVIANMDGQDVTTTLYDVYGRMIDMVYSGRVTNDHFKLTINLNAKASGIYFIRLESKSEAHNLKIVKY